jgi:hypothetical protein
MATIYRLTLGERWFDESGQEAPAFTRQLYPAVEVCSFCGEPHASAWWRGHQTISVCRKCAVEDLPRLLADALAGEHADAPNVVGSLHRALEQAEKNFWMASCCAIANAAERAKERRERK